MSSPAEPSGDSDGNGRRCSRRTVLRGGVAALGAATGLGGVATAQEFTPSDGITTKAVIIEQEQYEDLTGLFLHVEGETSPIDAAVSDQCDYVNWDDRATSAYDVVVLDRNQADVPQARTTLYLHQRVEVPPGALWVIDSQEPCGGGYVGIMIEQIGATELEAGLSSDLSPTETEGVANDAGGAGSGDASSGALGHGFGWLAGAGGLLGGGWLLRRETEE